MTASWRTTTAAVATVLIAGLSALIALIDGDPSTNPDWGAIGAAGTLAIGLFLARDNSVSSEIAGAK